jgi:hypothetical protein
MPSWIRDVQDGARSKCVPLRGRRERAARSRPTTTAFWADFNRFGTDSPLVFHAYGGDSRVTIALPPLGEICSRRA